MKMKHVALSVFVPEDIDRFYRDILGMETERRFTLDQSLTNGIFGIARDIPVFFLKKNDLFLEIFITDTKPMQGFNHICIAVDDRKALFESAGQKGYGCIHLQKEKAELFFIRDRSGNLFELKE